MNLQQLRYIIAVDDHRHFGRAAEACHVTQPTLSMMVQKLEEELGVKLFDRNRQPVVPTGIGVKVIRQARAAVRHAEEIPEVIEAERGTLRGQLRLGVIPTLAPYLLPHFVPSFVRDHPEVKLAVSEMVTGRIEEELREGSIDAGLLVTPLDNAALEEIPLFYEKFYAYLAHSHPLFDKEYILAEDIDVNQLWLLEEGHCFRSQILELCELKRSQVQEASFTYEAGSIETLRKFVERNNGITILPELATVDMREEHRARLRSFHKPEPVREVSLAIHRTYLKRRLVDALREAILECLPGGPTLAPEGRRVLEVNLP
ncbi:MAG: hydrogen peroxide-inducible genes activator [Balneolaceae bacterium]|nr:hydrogen peroxide-inducible genes activator [Balneolaceae bacterium]